MAKLAKMCRYLAPPVRLITVILLQPIRCHLRPAALSDAESIVRVHFAAVHGMASAYYPPEIVQSWSPEPDQSRFERVREAIKLGDQLFVVGEVDGIVRGFGSVVPKRSELLAVYVHPVVGRAGVGSALLEQVEQIAASCGVPQLRLDASLNAEAFYKRHGYTVVERSRHRLGPGVEMDCVRMSKAITPS